MTDATAPATSRAPSMTNATARPLATSRTRVSPDATAGSVTSAARVKSVLLIPVAISASVRIEHGATIIPIVL